MERTLNIVCDECDTDFDIVTESEDSPQFCPFCGEYIYEDGEDDDEEEDEEYDED